MVANTETPGLTFPRATFAKLAPGTFLHAHLKQAEPIRPSGRRPDEFRTPSINTGSLTHSNGSAVVRLGDTSVVCGVRAELLLASNIPRPSSDNAPQEDAIESLGLLVPNVELSTGCSPAHLPGNPPSGSAQSLSWRIHTLLHSADILDPETLTIRYTPPLAAEDDSEESSEPIVKAYWTLYIDILCISLDGNCFDAAWIAVMAALGSTSLPKAWWHPDQETIVCSPSKAELSQVQLKCLPIAASFAVFTTASPLRARDEAENWLLADPDGFEEDQCHERVTVVVTQTSDVVKIEKFGGSFVRAESLRTCIDQAHHRYQDCIDLLRGN